MSENSGPRRPRLLVLTSTLPRWLEDPEPRFVLDLACAISHRFETVILAPMAPGSKVRELMRGIDIRRFRYAPFRSWECLAAPGAIMPNLRGNPWLGLLIPTFFLGQLLAVIKLLRQEKFDAVHCHWIIPQGLVFRMTSLFVNVPPWLLTCHGADAFTLNTLPMRVIKRWILRAAGAITVVSREIGNFLAEEVNHKPWRRGHHIPMGVDLALFQPLSGPKQSKVPIILYVGRLSEKKGIEYLFRALAVEPLCQRNLQVRIVGNGPLRVPLEQLTHALGIADKVLFVGSLPHHKLTAEFGGATIFCAPSVVAKSGDREGTPTVLLEAAAAGLPIIASDIGGCGDVVESGHSGWLVAPGDSHAIGAAIVEALDVPGKAIEMASGVRKKVEGFSWSQIGRRYAEVIDELFETSARYEHERAL